VEAAFELNEPEAKVVDPTEVIVPSVATRVQQIGKDNYSFTFNQRPLSFFGKLDFFSVLGRALDRAMAGPTGISVADLLDVPDRPEGGVSKEDLKDADTFIRGISKLISYAPDIVGDLYCTILDVPRGERDVVKEIMALQADAGGLSDEDGTEILNVFFDQNWEVLRDFFTERIVPLLEKVGSKLKKEDSPA
jgi:hypothetical protein